MAGSEQRRWWLMGRLLEYFRWLLLKRIADDGLQVASEQTQACYSLSGTHRLAQQRDSVPGVLVTYYIYASHRFDEEEKKILRRRPL